VRVKGAIYDLHGFEISYGWLRVCSEDTYQDAKAAALRALSGTMVEVRVYRRDETIPTNAQPVAARPCLTVKRRDHKPDGDKIAYLNASAR
jgi:hypothetical protein